MVEPGEPERLGSRLAFETLLADLSSRFINLAPHDVGTEIDDAQRRICDHLGLELSSLWQWSPDATGMLTLTHLYRVVDGPPPPSPMAAAEYFPWIQEQLLAGRTVEFTSMTDLPPEAGRDAETLAHFGVKSGLIIPLGVGADLAIGTITFATVRRERACE